MYVFQNKSQMIILQKSKNIKSKKKKVDEINYRLRKIQLEIAANQVLPLRLARELFEIKRRKYESALCKNSISTSSRKLAGRTIS